MMARRPGLGAIPTLPEELEAADELLDQADALLHRHRGAASLMTATGDDLAADDLPLLTEVVEALPLASPLPPPQAVPESPAPGEVELAERLIALDGAIAHEVESWLANELPQLLSAELDRMAERLREHALAHMRATLLPALAEHVSHALTPGDPAPDPDADEAA